MKVWFGQIYVQPGVSFDFSQHFQLRLSEEITRLVTPSATFTRKYGSEWELIFRISAKTQINDNEIHGPSVFKADREIEYTIFLPFDPIARSGNVLRAALQFLLKGCCVVFRELDIDPALVEEKTESMIETIGADPKYLRRPME